MAKTPLSLHRPTARDDNDDAVTHVVSSPNEGEVETNARHDVSGRKNSDDDARTKEPGQREPSQKKPEQNEPGQSEPEQDEAKQSAPSLWQRHPMWFVAGGIALSLVIVVGFLYWSVAMHPYESTDDAFVDSRSFGVAAKVSGYVTEVAVTDNQLVHTGDMLFQIDRRDYETALAQAEAQIQASQASIRGYGAQLEAQQSTIEDAKAQVTQAQATLKFSQEDAARYQDLAQRGAGTVQRSQQSASDLSQQQAGLNRANATLSGAQKQVGSIQAQQASAVANLAQAQAQRDQAVLNLDYTRITAAQVGRVVRLTGAKGQYVQAGQSLSMFVPNPIWVTANYKETQINDMRPGQDVEVRIDAYPGRRITGKVASVQPGSGTVFSLLPAQNATGNYVKVVQRVPVKIVIDNFPDDVAIGPGMSVVPVTHVRDAPFYARWFSSQ